MEPIKGGADMSCGRMLVLPADRHFPKGHPNRLSFKDGYRRLTATSWQRTLEDGRPMIVGIRDGKPSQAVVRAVRT